MPMRYLSCWQIRLRLPMVWVLQEAFVPLWHQVTGASRISLDKFKEFCYQFLDNIDPSRRTFIVAKTDTIAHLSSFRGMKHRLLELLSAEWRFRLALKIRGCSWAVCHPLWTISSSSESSIALHGILRALRGYCYWNRAPKTVMPIATGRMQEICCSHASGWGTVVW